MRERAGRVFFRRIGGAALAVIVLQGCQSRVSERPRELSAGSQGGSWEAVFPSPYVAQRVAAGDAYPEYSRSDARLGVRSAQPVLATNEWPERARPDLLRARRITLETNPNQVLVLPLERESGSSGRTRGGYDSGGYVWWW